MFFVFLLGHPIVLAENFDETYRTDPKTTSTELFEPNGIKTNRPPLSKNFKEKYNWYASLTLGAYFTDPGKNQNLQISSTTFNQYLSSEKSRLVPEVGISIGKSFNLPDQFFLDTGIGLYRIGNITDKGTIYQSGNPSLDQLEYSFTIRSTRIMIETRLYKILRNTFQKSIYPYISVGIGSAINRADSYSDKLKNSSGSATMILPFSSNTITKFAYQIGLGFDLDITQEIKLGFGWQFVNVGNAELGLSPSQSVYDRLSTGNITTNGIKIHLTYRK